MKPETEKALQKVDFNINMFSKYPSSPYVAGTLAELRSDREQLLAWDADPTVKLSYSARQWMFEMPAWGYKGT